MRRLSSTFGRISDKENDCFYLNTTNEFYSSSLLPAPAYKQPQQYYGNGQQTSQQQQQQPYITLPRGQIATSRCVSQERIRCCYVVPPAVSTNNRRESLLGTTTDSSLLGPSNPPAPQPSKQFSHLSNGKSQQMMPPAPAAAVNTSMSSNSVLTNQSPRFANNDTRSYKCRIFDCYPPGKGTIVNRSQQGPPSQPTTGSKPKRQPSAARPRRAGEKPENQYIDTILATLRKKSERYSTLDSLRGHSITPALRAKMVDWMVEVFSSYKCRDETFFVGVNILDRYTRDMRRCLDGKEIHLIGIVSMFLATKYEEIFPFKISIVYEKIAHRKFTSEEIRRKESEILELLSFDLTGVTTLELAKCVLQAIFPVESNTSCPAPTSGAANQSAQSSVTKITPFENCINYLARMVMHDYDITSGYKYTEIAAGIVIAAMKLVPANEPTFYFTEERGRHVRDALYVSESKMSSLVPKIIDLYNNFEAIFPNLVNLKKFSPVDPFLQLN